MTKQKKNFKQDSRIKLKAKSVFFGKNLLKSFLVIFLAAGVIYAATNNYSKNTGDVLDATTWNNLGTEVTALRAELEALKTSKADTTYVDTKVAGVSGGVPSGVIGGGGMWEVNSLDEHYCTGVWGNMTTTGDSCVCPSGYTKRGGPKEYSAGRWNYDRNNVYCIKD
ncbi:MAG: hypothetical protein N4A38_05485 [Candidatus Gracilibacteria bacterium]|nr:hypothetical protein [Candidatus Gracilibacteria bacterium]